ncbi:MAG: cytochrome c [Chloroflexota bacterium]
MSISLRTICHLFRAWWTKTIHIHKPTVYWRFTITAGVLLGLMACSAPTGDPARGQQLFNGEMLIAEGNLPACNTCHADTVDGESPLGPNLSNIGNRASTTVEGQSAHDYLWTSIVSPDAYLSGGFQEGIMDRNYRQGLSDQEIADLVAYMLTLQSGQD